MIRNTIHAMAATQLVAKDDEGEGCELHHRHDPRPHQLHWHHVHPTGAGGPNTRANKKRACPTGHYNVHFLLDKMLKAGTVSVDTKRYTRFEVEWARAGFNAIKAYEAQQKAQQPTE